MKRQVCYGDFIKSFTKLADVPVPTCNDWRGRQMYNQLRYMTIQGIAVAADPSLSCQQINKLVGEVVQSWAWEGRQLGRIELIRDGQWVHVCSYEQPFIQVIPCEITKNRD